MSIYLTIADGAITRIDEYSDKAQKDPLVRIVPTGHEVDVPTCLRRPGARPVSSAQAMGLAVTADLADGSYRNVHECGLAA